MFVAVGLASASGAQVFVGCDVYSIRHQNNITLNQVRVCKYKKRVNTKFFFLG